MYTHLVRISFFTYVFSVHLRSYHVRVFNDHGNLRVAESHLRAIVDVGYQCSALQITFHGQYPVLWNNEKR